MRPLLLPGLLDAAPAQLGARARARGPVRVRPRLPARPARSTRRGGLSDGAVPAHERQHLAVLLTRGGRRLADRAPERTSSPPSAARGRAGGRGADWGAEAGGPAFLHPGRAAAVPRENAELGWLGELHPLGLRAWDLEGPVAAFEIDVDALLELTRATAALQRRDELPGGAAGHRGGGAGRGPAARVQEAVRSGRRGPARAYPCSTCTAASRWGRAASRSRCGSSSARPTAP